MGVDSKKRFLILSLLALAFLAGVTIGGYTLYQRHMSTEVRAAILASLGDNASSADVTEYLRAAKLAIRTKRDAYVVGLLDKTVAETESAERNRKTSWDLTMNGIRNLIPVGCQVYGFGTPQCRRDAAKDMEETKRNQELEKIFDTRAEAEGREALRLMGILRAEMGLPPAPDSSVK